VNSDGSDGQLDAGSVSCDDYSPQVAEAGVHHSPAYLLATQRYSSETA